MVIGGVNGPEWRHAPLRLRIGRICYKPGQRPRSDVKYRDSVAEYSAVFYVLFAPAVYGY